MALCEYERKGQNSAGSAAFWVVGEVSEMQKQSRPFYRVFYAQFFASRYPRDLIRIG